MTGSDPKELLEFHSLIACAISENKFFLAEILVFFSRPHNGLMDAKMIDCSSKNRTRNR